MKTKLSTHGKVVHLALLAVPLLAAPAAHAQQFGDIGAEDYDRFGDAVAVADFNNDGYADLAVGVPYEDIDTIVDAGAVEVIYGAADGLDSGARQFWHQDATDVQNVAETGDHFGFSLAAGDFNDDGYADLAIGVPYEDLLLIEDVGAVNVIYGSSTGLSATSIPDQYWDQDSESVLGEPEEDDFFGWSLTTGDFDGDGRSDLAIGVSGDGTGKWGSLGIGSVNVIYGSSTGLDATTFPNQLWNQDSLEVEGVGEDADLFGAHVTAGDFNGDGWDDLAIGVTLETVGAEDAAGAVNVIYGWSDGLNATSVPDQYWHQGVADVEGGLEAWDLFGSALAAGDFNGDLSDDLAIGVPCEDLYSSEGDIYDAGAVNVIYGFWLVGLSSYHPDELWHQLYVAPPVP